MFRKEDQNRLIEKLMNLTNRKGEKDNGTFGKVDYKSEFGLISIRPILFVFEKKKSMNDAEFWIDGTEILQYFWKCFCPEVVREECSTRYPFILWGTEFSDIVEYIKDRHKKGQDIGTLNEMYAKLIK